MRSVFSLNNSKQELDNVLYRQKKQFLVLTNTEIAHLRYSGWSYAYEIMV